MDAPNARERKSLEALKFGEWEYKAKPYAGTKTFASLIEHGWIEPFNGYNPDGDRYCITEAGRKAIAISSPVKPRSKTKLKTLAPRLKELPSRIK